MSFPAFVATVIIVLFLVTIVMAIGSYGAYKLRERRRPAGPPSAGARDGDGRYFERMDASELEARR
jgi:hypothetical protein